MGAPPAVCSNCGLRFPVRGIEISDSYGFSFSDVETDCPRCGGRANVVDGTYDFVGDVISAFRAPGVSRQSVATLRDIAEAVKTGETSREQAEAKVAELGAALAGVWKWTNDNGSALSVLLAIIALYLSITSGWDADEAAEKIQASVEKQTQVVQMIKVELRKQNVTVPGRETSSPARPQRQQLAPPHLPGVKRANRHERRKAMAKAKRR